MNKYAYYPGCSIKGSAKQYEESLFSVCNTLGIELEELPDWNCCGATMYVSVDEKISFALSSRNLVMAEETGMDLMAPCSACYVVLKKTQDYIQKYPEIRASVDKALTAADLVYRGTVRVRHPLEIFINDVGIEKIKSSAKQKLDALKIACYYGCQIVRPFQEFDHPCYPESMDNIFRTLGAQTVDWAFKTRCCGGSLTGTIEEVGLRLNYILIKEAQRKGANCIVTICPLCQFNLEAYQHKILKKYRDFSEMPVLYFTQIMGLGFGIAPEKLGVKRSIISPNKIIEKLTVPKGQDETQIPVSS